MLFCSLFGFVGCEQEEPTPAASLVLSVDCNEIANDGLALASFMVKKDGVNVTSECRFYNVESGEPLSGAYFTSTVAGTYTFYAVMGMEKSNTVEVKVVDGEWVAAEMIPTGHSFTIDGQKFNFDSGMYWHDWLISDYNTIDASEEEVEFIPGMYQILSSGGFVLYNSSGEQVSPTDEIIENEAYAWK